MWHGRLVEKLDVTPLLPHLSEVLCSGFDDPHSCWPLDSVGMGRLVSHLTGPFAVEQASFSDGVPVANRVCGKE